MVFKFGSLGAVSSAYGKSTYNPNCTFDSVSWHSQFFIVRLAASQAMMHL